MSRRRIEIPQMVRIGLWMMVPPAVSVFVCLLAAAAIVAFGSGGPGSAGRLPYYALFSCVLIMPGFATFLFGIVREGFH